MKTNQMMEVNLGNYGSVSIGHKTRMGSADEVVKIGNEIRESKGLSTKTLHTYLRRKDTWEKIIKVHNEAVKSVRPIGLTLLYETLNQLPYDGHGKIKYSEVLKTGYFDNIVKSQTRGKLANRGKWFEVILLLDLAEWLDVDLWYEVHSTFIDGKILEYRDLGGNSFKLLNEAIDTLPDRSPLLKPKGNRGCYINMARLMRAKLEIAGKGYNNADHDELVQSLRDKYEQQLIMLINAGFVNSYPELKIAISKI